MTSDVTTCRTHGGDVSIPDTQSFGLKHPGGCRPPPPLCPSAQRPSDALDLTHSFLSEWRALDSSSLGGSCGV